MAEVETPAQARQVVYCGVCTLPPEYCEFGGTAKKCEEWLKENESDLWDTLYSEGTKLPCYLAIIYIWQSHKPGNRTDILTVLFFFFSLSDALSANLSTLSVSAQERAAKDAAKKEAKAAANEARDSERKAASKVQIKRVERNKRKYVTVVIGLEVFGLENKKIAKDLGKKFATGSSVTRSPAGIEEITVQGDVSDDLREWLLEIHGKKIPASNIELIEDKKKKKSEGPMV
ncbi:Density-regulated protein DRP1 [Penicillium cf. griseofulvum]|nr:Density-regulated protein DRP1 [Penicillium cf. griseofulvum]